VGYSARRLLLANFGTAIVYHGAVLRLGGTADNRLAMDKTPL
jgi:hypothetical protein